MKSVKIAVADPKASSKAFKPLSSLADAIILARDLVSEPANILYPEEYARRVKKLGDLGLEVEVLGEKEMKKLGMGSLLGVGQGSVRESQLVVLQWKGAKDPAAQPIAFVGKGVCFDTGGISLKPAEGMEEMITDMGGSAAVVGAMYALAARKAKVNAVGILGLVENMPDGNAQRPGDIVTSMSGQTIEVINTDAEGRLVLADAIWYCHTRFKPKILIDLATLTGAIVVALGKDLAGVYSNNENLAANLMAASKASDDVLWRMPLAGAVRQAARQPGGRHEEHRPAPRRLDHRGDVHPAVRERRALGPHRHGVHRLEAELGRAHDPLRRHRLRRAAAGPAVGGLLRGLSHGAPSFWSTVRWWGRRPGGRWRTSCNPAGPRRSRRTTAGWASRRPMRRAGAEIAGQASGAGWILVVHSGAGGQAPSILAAMDRAAGVIFADAILPHPGRSWMETAPPALAEASARPGHGRRPAALEPMVRDTILWPPCCTTGGCARRSPRSCRAFALDWLETPAPVVEAWAPPLICLSAAQRRL